MWLFPYSESERGNLPNSKSLGWAGTPSQAWRAGCASTPALMPGCWHGVCVVESHGGSHDLISKVMGDVETGKTKNLSTSHI
ncbi:hypothetical protein CEXT_124381 [Caerostris extrusa]|uniref:Uncharacterized protein n=1 Tax=Caerostris extrusa TaxID=172846 RepID=A0AAV4RT97_CAEEX|nr:hypothetical protein CEXT_124381 [Caerostris extrusa]